MRLKPSYLPYPFLGMAILILIAISCESTHEQEEQMARQYCSSCHAFPEAALLDKKTWDLHVLPQMAFRMGLNSPAIMSAISPSDLSAIQSTLPAEPVVNAVQWEMIRQYYLTNAPDSLAAPNTGTIDTLKLFAASEVSGFNKPIITLIKFDSLLKKIYVGNRFGKLYELDQGLRLKDSIQLPGTPSQIRSTPDQQYISVMGTMDPSERTNGRLLLRTKSSGRFKSISDSLQRPVDFEKADFNRDGIDDYVICAFGNFTGRLWILEGKADSTFDRHILNPLPGARKVIVRDFNQDGKKDILVLMTQGDEKVILYTNRGEMKFSETVLLQFPPVYGSTYFEFTDMNGDGLLDLLTTHGDNGDYSVIVKPYHGIRLYLNDGKNNFTETWSYSLPGASQTAARDFDLDGDMDLAAISFFPDFSHKPILNFMYFENKGNNQFQPQFSPLTSQGRWLVMESADYDGDGDVDLVLGAANFTGLGANPEAAKSWSTRSTLFLLKNLRH